MANMEKRVFRISVLRLRTLDEGEPGDTTMNSTKVVASVYQGLVSKIASGQYPVGSLLPGCRILARELGVNKNTVARAFQTMLQQGLVRRINGVGMLVTRVLDDEDEVHKRDVLSELDVLIRHARALGIQRRSLEHALCGLTEKWYGGSRILLALVECNIWDARSLARDIESRIGIPVTPVLLDDFLHKAEAVLTRYHLILTTFYHLSEIYSVVPESERRAVVAIRDNPSVKSLLAISAIPSNARIAILAGHERTVKQLERTLETCGHKAAYAYTVTTDDAERLKAAVKDATVIVESERCHKEVVGARPDVPVIVVSFELDSESLAFVRKRLGALAADAAVASSSDSET